MEYNYKSLRKHMEGLKNGTYLEQEQFIMHILDYYNSHIPAFGDEDDDAFLKENGISKEDFLEALEDD